MPEIQFSFDNGIGAGKIDAVSAELCEQGKAEQKNHRLTIAKGPKWVLEPGGPWRVRASWL